MGMCTSGDIFQAKVDKLLGDIKGVKTYVDDIIVLSRDRFKKHMDQLIMIFDRLRATGLKDNAPKCSFRLKDILYLVYVITRDVIKPDPKKLQGIIYMTSIWNTSQSLPNTPKYPITKTILEEIAGLDTIANSFKVANIEKYTNIR